MQAKYEIVVEARDAQGLRGESGTATVLVTLQDINDNFPIFTQRELFPQGPGEDGGWENPDSVTWGILWRSPEYLHLSLNPRVSPRPSKVTLVAGRGSASHLCTYSQGCPNATCHSALTGHREIMLPAMCHHRALSATFREDQFHPVSMGLEKSRP